MENENNPSENPEIVETGGRSGGFVEDLTIDDLVKETVKSMPDVSAQVVNDAGAGGGADRGGPGGVTTGLVDKYDRPFDPAIHVANTDGSPKINKAGKAKGKIAIKRFQKKPARASRVAKPSETKTDQPEKPASGMSPEMAGKVAADLTFTVGMAAGGDEFRPIIDKETGVNEPLTLQRAYGAYFAARGVSDVPPGWLLVVALGSYVLPRLVMEKTRGRVAVGLGKMGRAGKWLLSKLKRGKRGTFIDSRHDGKRKNDISKEDRESAETSEHGSDLSRSYP